MDSIKTLTEVITPGQCEPGSNVNKDEITNILELQNLSLTTGWSVEVFNM